MIIKSYNVLILCNPDDDLNRYTNKIGDLSFESYTACIYKLSKRWHFAFSHIKEITTEKDCIKIFASDGLDRRLQFIIKAQRIGVRRIDSTRWYS
jgi:hypothetical protein